jgi:hypothetical protein
MQPNEYVHGSIIVVPLREELKVGAIAQCVNNA